MILDDFFYQVGTACDHQMPAADSPRVEGERQTQASPRKAVLQALCNAEMSCPFALFRRIGSAINLILETEVEAQNRARILIVFLQAAFLKLSFLVAVAQQYTVLVALANCKFQ